MSTVNRQIRRSIPLKDFRPAASCRCLYPLTANSIILNGHQCREFSFTTHADRKGNLMKTADRYQNFRAALYIRALDIAPLGDDITPMTRQFEKLNEFVGFGKVYLETHRDMVVPEKKT